MMRPSTRLGMKTALALELALTLVAAGPSIVVTGQLLAYQDGFVFFTTGDGFRVAPGVVIHDAKTGGTTQVVPAPRIWARATFDATGTVTELDLSRAPLPPEGNFADVTRFAVAASSPAPNSFKASPASLAASSALPSASTVSMFLTVFLANWS